MKCTLCNGNMVVLNNMAYCADALCGKCHKLVPLNLVKRYANETKCLGPGVFCPCGTKPH